MCGGIESKNWRKVEVERKRKSSFFSAVTERVRKNIETVQSKLSNSGTNKKKCQISEGKIGGNFIEHFHEGIFGDPYKLC